MKGFKNIFWGSIFLIINFRIFNIDIMPDIIGFWLIFTGLKDITDLSNYFGSAKRLSIAVMVISLGTLYQVHPSMPQFQIGEQIKSIEDLTTMITTMFNQLFSKDMLSYYIINSIYGVILTTLELLLLYKICWGIRDVALQRELIKIGNSAKTRWIFYSASNILFWLLTSVFYVLVYTKGFALWMFLFSTGITISSLLMLISKITIILLFNSAWKSDLGRS